jgi:hypothetical protein
MAHGCPEMNVDSQTMLVQIEAQFIVSLIAVYTRR